MVKELMSFNKFKRIMETIQDFIDQRDRINEFFEKEIMKDSYCIITLGLPIEDVLINMLADEFDCWYAIRENDVDFNWWESEGYTGSSNEISDWFYNLRLDENEPRVSLEIEGIKIKINTLEEFYSYLASQYYKKQAAVENLT